jgi:hypothetical protein
MAKAEVRWFFGVDNKTDFLDYLDTEYSEEKMRVLHPDDMQSIADEALEVGSRLGITCPGYIGAMSEDPTSYMEQAFADGLIPDYHEITRINDARGTDYKNNYDYMMKRQTMNGNKPANTNARGPVLAPSVLDAFASDADSESIVVTAADIAEDIVDLDAYIAKASGDVSGSDEDSEDDDEDEE